MLDWPRGLYPCSMQWLVIYISIKQVSASVRPNIPLYLQVPISPADSCAIPGLNMRLNWTLHYNFLPKGRSHDPHWFTAWHTSASCTPAISKPAACPHWALGIRFTYFQPSTAQQYNRLQSPSSSITFFGDPSEHLLVKRFIDLLEIEKVWATSHKSRLMPSFFHCPKPSLSLIVHFPLSKMRVS